MSHTDHEGPCILCIGHTLDGEHTARQGLDAALDWTVGLPEYDGIRDTARAALASIRPLPEHGSHRGVAHYAAIDPAGRVALEEIAQDATDYWVNCGYGNEEGDDDQWLGLQTAAIMWVVGACHTTTLARRVAS